MIIRSTVVGLFEAAVAVQLTYGRVLWVFDLIQLDSFDIFNSLFFVSSQNPITSHHPITPSSSHPIIITQYFVVE